MINNINGYSLFNEVEDKELQLRNRTTTLVNMIEDNMTEEGVVNQQGMFLSMQYWTEISDEEKKSLYDSVKAEVEERKLIPGGI